MSTTTDPTTALAITPEQAQARLAEAKVLVAEAEAREMHKRHARQIEDLAAVREEHRTGLARYKDVRFQIYEAREARGNAQAKVNRALEARREWERKRPEVAPYLPDDPEVKAWRKEFERLDTKLAQAMAARDALPDPEGAEFAEAITYEGPAGKIAQLENAERNLLRQIEGGTGIVRLEGGVYTVG